MLTQLSPNKQKLLVRMRELAQAEFFPRATQYDVSAAFPKENVKALQRAGLLAPTLANQYGGLGLGHHKGDIFTHWMLTKEIGKADMAFARIWEGQANALLLIDNLGAEAQKERWGRGVVENGELWSVWSGEPQSKKPGQKKAIGTTVQELPNGYIINGSKVFCSGAAGVDRAILLVNTEGTGAARHATQSPETVIMLACDMSDESIQLDDAWWNPMGMRASTSWRVLFNNTFIPKENLIGKAGDFLSGEWQTRFTPQYMASFLGGAEHAYDYALNYIHTQKKGHDAYIQHRIAKMSINIRTANLWLRHVATLWESGDIKAAKLEGSYARYLIEQLVMECLTHAIHICGARCLIRPSSLERVYRDASFYARHDNDDQVLAMIGKNLLGETHDISFFKDSSSPKQ